MNTNNSPSQNNDSQTVGTYSGDRHDTNTIINIDDTQQSSQQKDPQSSDGEIHINILTGSEQTALNDNHPPSNSNQPTTESLSSHANTTPPPSIPVTLQ